MDKYDFIVGMSEEQVVIGKRARELKNLIWRNLFSIDDIGAEQFVSTVKPLLAELKQLEVSEDYISAQRKRERRVQMENEQSKIKLESRTVNRRLSELSRQLKSLKVSKYKSQVETTQAEILALEGRKRQLAEWAASNGVLEPSVESKDDKIVNDQLRARSGPIRVESGDGR